MDEAEERKQRSIADLKSRGVAVLASLPRIERESEARVRKPREIARRALCLGSVASVAFGSSRRFIRDYVSRNGLDRYLAPEERDYLSKARSTKNEKIKFRWRIEAAVPLMWALGQVAVPLMWALGQVKELPPNAEEVDATAFFKLFPTFNQNGGQFIKSATRY